MNKEEFLKKLSKKLEVLEDTEIEDIVSEYDGYIDEKVNAGLTEEEAVKELGDFEEIVSDLLAAYKLKNNPRPDSGFNRVINTISDGIDSFMDSLDNKTGRDIIKLLIEIIIILFIICLLKIPFSMIKDLGSSIFDTLPIPFSNLFTGIWYFIIEFSYIVVAVVFFVKTFQKRYFQDFTDHIMTKQDDEKKEDSKKDNKQQNKKKKNIEKAEEKDKEVKKVVNSPRNKGIIDVLVDVCMGLLKFVVIIFLFGVVCYLVGISIAIGVMIYLIAKGVSYFGIFILLIVLFFGGTFILELGIKFICNKKIGGLAVFSKLVALIVLTGVGLSLSAIEIANTDIIYDNSNLNTKSITKEIPMTNNLHLYDYDKIVVDNNLNDTIRIEYVYPDYGINADIKIKLERVDYGYTLKTDISKVKWNKKILDKLIVNLKDKKIYTYDFRLEKIVYMSEENYKMMMKNYYNYYHHHNNAVSTFNKEYNILDIEQSEDEYYLYLSLKEGQNARTANAKVAKNILGNIEEGKNYMFTFECEDYYRDSDIEDLFTYCKILNVRLTNYEA